MMHLRVGHLLYKNGWQFRNGVHDEHFLPMPLSQLSLFRLPSLAEERKENEEMRVMVIASGLHPQLYLV